MKLAAQALYPSVCEVSYLDGVHVCYLAHVANQPKHNLLGGLSLHEAEERSQLGLRAM